MTDRKTSENVGHVITDGALIDVPDEIAFPLMDKLFTHNKQGTNEIGQESRQHSPLCRAVHRSLSMTSDLYKNDKYVILANNFSFAFKTSDVIWNFFTSLMLRRTHLAFNLLEKTFFIQCKYDKLFTKVKPKSITYVFYIYLDLFALFLSFDIMQYISHPASIDCYCIQYLKIYKLSPFI